VARKQKGSPQWFLGAITDEEARTFDVPLTFLDAGKSYTADIYADGPGANWLTNPTPVRITHRTVTRASRLRIVLAPGGGQAIRIRPATAPKPPATPAPRTGGAP
jgi:alpha-glucosidase